MSPYCRFIPSYTELFPLTVGHNVNLNKLQAVLIVLLKKKSFSSIFSIFFIYFHNFLLWREEHFDLKESLETMKKRYGTYGRKES
jgi:hypothetical protein